VRSFQTCTRNRSLTTGTFNQVVKDRIALRLSGAHSVQIGAHIGAPDCPRNLTNIPRSATTSQRKRPTEFPPDFHNRKKWSGGRLRPPSRAKLDGTRGTQPAPIGTVTHPAPWKSGPSRAASHSKRKEGVSPSRRAQQYGLPPGKAFIPAPGISGRAKAED
jgi:hypothetical protein